ncbi:hypothetical protein N9H93_02720 [Rhizobiaceae bacterium]|nr:hypothetical protein [Rhizobiaceae bacterium]
MKATISKDPTLATIWSTLWEARIFVAQVRHTMGKCVTAHGSASVRIGVTGKGLAPCYRISWSDEGIERIANSYWYDHTPFGRQDVEGPNWSTATMNYAEVDALLREKTGIPKPKVAGA